MEVLHLHRHRRNPEVVAAPHRKHGKRALGKGALLFGGGGAVITAGILALTGGGGEHRTAEPAAKIGAGPAHKGEVDATHTAPAIPYSEYAARCDRLDPDKVPNGLGRTFGVKGFLVGNTAVKCIQNAASGTIEKLAVSFPRPNGNGVDSYQYTPAGWNGAYDHEVCDGTALDAKAHDAMGTIGGQMPNSEKCADSKLTLEEEVNAGGQEGLYDLLKAYSAQA